MRAAFGFQVKPFGVSQVLSINGIEVVRNIFKGPDGLSHRTYEAKKASKSFGTFPVLGDAIDAAKKAGSDD